MPGREVPVAWRGRTIRAWLPDPLTDADPPPTSARLATATERARQAVLHADDRTPAGWEPLARLLLRAEGVASSFIEGVRAGVPEVAAAQLAPESGTGAAAWVAANLEVLDRAVEHAHGAQPLTLADLDDWHRRLMAGHSSLPPHLVGALRDEQGWIGGTTPLDAALVTAPPDALAGLVLDLVRYVNGTEVDPVTQAAVGHAQFEIIHPYGDGNGRLGRVLVLWILARRTGVRVLPPISTRIAAEPGAYLAELTRFRLEGGESWIRWFADTVALAAGGVSATVLALARLQDTWALRLDADGVRRDAAARRLLRELPRFPVLTSALAGRLAGVSERSGRTALETLGRTGILAPYVAPATARSPLPDRYRWWYAPDVAELVARVFVV